MTRRRSSPYTPETSVKWQAFYCPEWRPFMVSYSINQFLKLSFSIVANRLAKEQAYIIKFVAIEYV